MANPVDKSRVFLFKHGVKECGAGTLVSNTRFAGGEDAELEIICQQCRKPFKVRRQDAEKELTLQQAREMVQGSLEAQGYIDLSEEAPM